MNIYPDALIFFNHCTVLEFRKENTPEENVFYVELVYGRFYLKFERSGSSDRQFVATEVIGGCFPSLYPVVSSLGVLWHRQVTVEADLCTSASPEEKSPQPTGFLSKGGVPVTAQIPIC